MMRMTIGAILALGLAAQGHAVALKVGYGNINGELSFPKSDGNIKGYNRTTETEDIGIGVITVGAEHMVALDDMFSIGLEIGGSTAGEFEFDFTKMRTPVAGQPNEYEGDSSTTAMRRVPVLARANAQFPMNGMTAYVGLGAGVIIAPWTSESVDQEWTDGTAGGDQADKDSTHTTKFATDTTWDSGTFSLFVFEIAPGIEMKMGEKATVGLEIPLSLTSETTLSGREYKTETAVANVANPEIKEGVWKFGGFDWGIRLVYTRKL